MAPRLPSRWAAALNVPSPSTLSLTTQTTTTSIPSTRLLLAATEIPGSCQQHALPLLPRTSKRGVKYGWSTAPPRAKHTRFNQITAGLPTPTTGPAAALKRKENTTPLRTGVLAIKKGVSAMFVKKMRVAVTILQMDQVQVVANKTRESNGYFAVQVGFGSKEPGNVTAPMLGYYEAKGVAPKRHLAEFKVRTADGLLPVGLQLQPDWFKLDQYVDARSNSRGMGFAGGMKRHGFAGQEASHGNSKNHRTIGSTGPSQGGGSRVHPGKKMPGRMGGERVTVQNLRVLKVDNEMGIVVVKGHVAGPKGCLVMLADAIKKDPPAQTFIDKVRRISEERSPGLKHRLERARKAHLILKEGRQQGKVRSAFREVLKLNLPAPPPPPPQPDLVAAAA